MNPYEILGLDEGASSDIATARYNILVRKLKEADLSGNPLEKDRNHRMLQLRAAYEEIIYAIPMPANLAEPFIQDTSLVQTSCSPFSQVEELIDNQRYEEAIQKLNLMTDRTAHWNFLYGWALHNKGMVKDSVTYLQLAYTMEPNEPIYLEYYQKVQDEINKAIQEEQSRKNREIAGGAALVGTGICASCMCDACCNS